MAKAMQRVNSLGLIESEPRLKTPVLRVFFTKTLSASAATPPQLRLPDQPLILVGEQIALNLRHRIHGHADHDQQRRAAKVERHRGVGNQNFSDRSANGGGDTANSS